MPGNIQPVVLARAWPKICPRMRADVGYDRARRPPPDPPPFAYSIDFLLVQDIDGDSDDDDIPELEEQVGGDDSAEVCGTGETRNNVTFTITLRVPRVQLLVSLSFVLHSTAACSVGSIV